MPFTWTQQAGEVWTTAAGPFVLEVRPKGDGRWTWQVTKQGGRNAEATGVARSFGAAKSVSEQYVTRSGHL
jgi:hypothetical protein